MLTDSKIAYPHPHPHTNIFILFLIIIYLGYAKMLIFRVADLMQELYLLF